MSRSDDVCVLIPTLDEATTIEEVITEFRDLGYENLLVIDGGSTDNTQDLAREAGARVVGQSGTGKGQAIREAVEHHVHAPYVLMIDGDGTYQPSDAEAMLEPLLEGAADHVVGDRFADMRPDAMSRLNKIGNQLINRSFALIHGESYGDILSGYRAFTRQSFERMTITAEGFGVETQLSVECAKQDITVAVVPITYLPRPHGSNTNLHPVRDGGIIFLELFRKAKTNNPLFYFGSIGFLSTVFGVFVGLYVGYRWFIASVGHEILAILSVFGILFGVQLLMFGVLSDLILTLHREQLDRIEETKSE